ncbi:flagellar motor protein MotB [Pantoea sp. A4]|uniref:flagellar motor protein MotB n=1 Tax=Pantoea sp. A4 TaxID=1225184 RepID=UPI000364B93A|nr:flagellar motor protein MotB [Pantoea sp. A4]
MKAGQGHATIIKRGGKKGHHAHHGGAWKVAFADFTLAMMALFMVLWIIASSTKDERREVVASLHGTSVFSGSAFYPFNNAASSGTSAVGQPEGLVSTEGSLPVETAEISAAGPATEQMIALSEKQQQSLEQLSQLWQKITEVAALLDAQGHVTLEAIPQGLRVQIHDDKNRNMFVRGSAVLTPYFATLLRDLAPLFAQLDNPLMISGHTDGTRYRAAAQYDNWNLSGERALAARRTLISGGLPETRVMQVNGLADRMLLDRENPAADRNRRIEIMVLTDMAVESLSQFYGQSTTG